MKLVESKYGVLKDTRTFVQNPLTFLQARQKEYGDYFSFRLVTRKVNVVCSPEGVKHILQTNNKNYCKDQGYQQLRLILGNGLLTNEGESWFKQRRLAQPAFYKNHLEEVFNIMGKVAEEYMQRMETFKATGQAIDIHPEMMTVTLEAVLRGLFGTTMSMKPETFYERFNFLHEHIVKRIRRPFLLPWMFLSGEIRRFNKEKTHIINMIADVIDKRRTEGSPQKDLLAMFMEARDEDTGEAMGQQQLIDESMTMVAAGHETSANALSWAVYLLSQRPDIWAKIKGEADTVFGNSIPTFKQVHELQYTKQVLEEVMRLYPPAWTVGRVALEKDTVCGYEIEPKTITLTPMFLLHKDNRYWENPEDFNPERFSPEQNKERDKFHYFPFGAGPRMCIGNHFAMMEMQLLLSLYAQRFNFSLAPDQNIEPQALVTVRPKYGIKVFVN